MPANVPADLASAFSFLGHTLGRGLIAVPGVEIACQVFAQHLGPGQPVGTCRQEANRNDHPQALRLQLYRHMEPWWILPRQLVKCFLDGDSRQAVKLAEREHRPAIVQLAHVDPQEHAALASVVFAVVDQNRADRVFVIDAERVVYIADDDGRSLVVPGSACQAAISDCNGI